VVVGDVTSKTGSVSPMQKKLTKGAFGHHQSSKDNTSTLSQLKKVEERNITGKKQLLQSLNDLGDQLTKPSIREEDKDKPQWL